MSRQDRERRRPGRLGRGDLVAVVAPAGPVREEALVAGVKVLESLGFRVELGANLRERRGYLAGSDEARAEDLNRAFRDPDVRGVFCARGGYGSTRLLGLVDYEAVRADPKVFVGYSDVTALHLALDREAGLVTFHGPGVESLGHNLTRLTLDAFARAVATSEPLDILPVPEDYPAPALICAGRATGHLIGGNLSLLCATLGTPWEVETKDRILLVEDVNEEPYRVDRMLTHLVLAGKLDRAAGFVAGEMIRCAARPSPPGGSASDPAPDSPSAEAVLAERLTSYGKPALGGLPCGHGRDKWTLPLGVAVTVDAYKARLIVEEAACE